ncbi:MAG: hypothetical protein PHX83_04450 [Acidobacteriia bacterium]|nr:hypothetical protein [Terriglobia bacterium]
MQIKQNKNIGFILIAVLMLTYSIPCKTQEIDLGNVPDDVLMEFGMGTFAKAYSVSGRINPFYLRGDFDGDGKPDYAVQVVARKDRSRGIAIWLSSQKKIFVLGAGHLFKFSASESTDFEFINVWQVYGKRLVEHGVDAGPPPELVGEAIHVGKRESASGLIYWNGKLFLWYQQGD